MNGELVSLEATIFVITYEETTCVVGKYRAFRLVCCLLIWEELLDAALLLRR